MNPLRRVDPTEVGIDPRLIRSFLADLERSGQEVHSFVVARHGSIAYERTWSPYHADDVHVLNSLSKSFTSTAVGFAVSEGHLSLDDPVIRFFAADAPAEISENLAKMKVRHLLSMSVGHEVDSIEHFASSSKGNWAEAFLARPVPREPGTHFVYNSGATYMLAVIVETMSGQSLLDYLRPRLFDKIGIEKAKWDRCPRGFTVGGWGMSINIDAITRFGVLLANDGVWEGERVLPEGWVATATAKHVSNGDGGDNDWCQGYGFQFWRCQHSCFRGDGAFGQNCVVAPDLGLVLATTGTVEDLQALLTLFWRHFVLPLRGGAAPEDASEPGEAILHGPAGEFRPIPAGTYTTIGETEVVRELRFTDDQLELVTRSDTHRLPIAAGWTEVSLDWDWVKKAAVRCAWTTGDECVIRVQSLESPTFEDHRIRFVGDEIQVSLEWHGTLWGPPSRMFVAVRAE